ncbi:MAG: phosphate regulon sensor histidine kinase PhoR [Comamonadaceae bacterium CG1_02_60_18]|nr:MAG: phosphate regulon sensor histidine kinase PhoR [Comamonadaceae bacterium CG1_02_60_18]PIQ51255.1 MAG: phosphate regulon sensor histidine kinase PhoR [Comamonadaceae bacterium CG12_big_fil_rev_8_21_14_0_65_59_15]
MFWRISGFVVYPMAGASAGWVLSLKADNHVAALWGALAGVALWFVLDALSAEKALRYLRTDIAEQEAPFRSGVWGELLERARRLYRAKDKSRQEAEKRLHDFLSAFQASPNGVVLLDDKDSIEWCNQTAAAHFGLDPRRDLQQTIGNLVRDPGFATYLAGRSFDHALLMPGRGNSPGRPVRLSVQLHPYGEGRSLLLSRDVTALEQAEAMRRDFVANVSHEIRTPLTVLSGFVETLQTLELDKAEQQQYLGLMETQASRMQSLVSDLLTLSKLEGSPSPDFDHWIAAADLMQRLEQDAHALSALICGSAPLHDMAFACQYQGRLVGNVSELLSAMGNLVSNAVRYTPPGGRIAVSLQQAAEGALVFAVQDSGPGIAPEHLPRLTERFYRVDRSRSRETGGTGLGLAIVKHVAQRHGAELSIDSTPGQGSAFRLTFPAVRTTETSLADWLDDGTPQ